VISVAIEVTPSTGQDRAAAFALPDRTIIVLADGAGGTGGGAAAATAIVDAVRSSLDDSWGDLLVDLDADPRRLGAGQATAVILTVRASASTVSASVIPAHG
jgi:PPM family protein phosphatase